MQFFQSINLLQNTENPLNPGNLANLKNNHINGPGFDHFLNQQLNTNPTNHLENNQYYSDLQENNRNTIADNKSYDANIVEKSTNITNENEKVNNPVKDAVNQPKNNKSELSNSKTDNQKTAAVEESVDNEKIEKKNTKPVPDLSFFLKDILSLLDMIKEKGLSKGQLKELKSALLELNDQLLLNKKKFFQGKELQALLKKLKHLLGSSNKKLTVNIKNQKEILEPADLKQQISTLKNEISKHLKQIAEKAENVAVKNNDTGDLNKNSVTNKLQVENTVTEAKDFSEIKDSSGNKENSSNHNFQFLKKEADIETSLSKSNVQAALKKSNFSEQLNKLVQNAKIYIKDSKNGSFSLRLYPESLGRVNVNLNLEHGVIIGKFLVENTDAKEALMDNMAAVRERLQENGIAVGDFQVNVRDQNNPTSNFNEEQFLYIDTAKHNASVNSQYEMNTYYHHEGEIDLVI